MSIARYSVTRPVAVTMINGSLLLLGIICLLRLPVDLLPRITLPTVSISTQWANVSPEAMEAQITRPIEQAVASVPGLYEIQSSTSTGSSNVRVQLDWGTDIGQAAIDIMQRLERVKRRFPNDTSLGTPTVTKFDPNQSPIMSFGVYGEKDQIKLRTILDNRIAPIIESAEGVAAVNVSGSESRAIIVDIDPVRLRAYGLSLADITRRLMEENINAPAGIARESDTEYTLRSMGWITSLATLQDLPLTANGNQVVALGDVAEIRDAHQEARVLTRLNGEPAAGISITKQSDANTVTTAAAVRARLQRVSEMYPNLKFRVVYDQSGFVKSSINDLMLNALIGAILATLVLLFFLRNVQSTLVIAISIPISVVATFVLIYFGGFSLNSMSLSGLALAIGMIVDNAVVVLENIFRHMERNRQSPFDAAINGTNEIMLAIVASTLTAMVVFLPLLIIKGQSGQMFTQFALVIIFSMAVSLLIALTLVPMLATRLIREDRKIAFLEDDPDSRWQKGIAGMLGRWLTFIDSNYQRGLQWAMQHRWRTVGGALGASLLVFLLIPFLGMEAIPETDTGDMNVSISLPSGTALAKTEKVMRQVEKIVLDHPDVDTAFTTIGSGGAMRGGGSGTPNRGGITVRLKEDRHKSTQEVINDLRGSMRGLAGVRPSLRRNDIVSSMMTGGNQNIQVIILGNDLGTLTELSRQAMRLLDDVPGLENLDVNWEESMPEIQWKVDRRKAAQLGVSFEDISDTLNASTSGSIATYYQEEGFQYPIVVQLNESERKTMASIANLTVTRGSGSESARNVVLRQVAEPTYAMGPSQITRQGMARYISVSGAPMGRSSGEIEKDVKAALSKMEFPQGYYWDWGSNQKRRAEEYAGMGLAVVLAVGIIFMLLAIQFESMIYPLSILLSIPLASTGVILGLFLTGRSFGLTALIGLLMLVGIVVKSAIILVDYINVLRARGIPRDQAVLQASPTRLRPILMTSLTTIIGMMPIALAMGKGTEIQTPMATAVVGGLITSTLLTLFVVPVAYTLLDDAVIWYRRRGEVSSAAE